MGFLSRHPYVALYVVGCIVAFAICFVIVLVNIGASFMSAYAHNLRQIGARVSWLYGLPKEIDEDDFQGFVGYLKKFAGSLVFCAFNAIQSWLYVVLVLFGWALYFFKSFGVPKDIREARWRLKNLRLDFDGVLRLVKAIEGKADYARDRAELLASLKERKLITDWQFDRLMADQPPSRSAA